MKQLINMMYPSLSPQRSEIREEWNEQDSIPWDNYLYNKSLYRANGVIAEFMGYAVTGDIAFILGMEEHLGAFPYTTNWNYLMPVVDKIEELGYRFEMSSSPEAGGKPRGYGFIAFTLPRGQISSAWKSEITEEQGSGNWATTRINATYLAVVRFIIWYNENNNENG